MENNICPNCGIILEEGIEECPLCQSKSIEETIGDREVYPSDILHLTNRRSKLYAWELSAIIAFSANLLCLIVDLVIVKGLDWSLYALTSITGLWLLITSFAFFLKKPVLLGLNLSLVTLAMLIIYDLLHKPLSWFADIGLPVSLSFWILFAIFLLISGRTKLKGFNMLAYIFIELAAFCIIIDIFTDLHIRGRVFIDWSAITAATLVPFAGVLLFLHYRMKKGKDLGSFFHV